MLLITVTPHTHTHLEKEARCSVHHGAQRTRRASVVTTRSVPLTIHSLMRLQCLAPNHANKRSLRQHDHGVHVTLTRSFPFRSASLLRRLRTSRSDQAYGRAKELPSERFQLKGTMEST